MDLNDVVAKAERIFNEKANMEKVILPDTNLLALGINSIDFIKIIVALEIEFNIEFDEDRLAHDSFKTIVDRLPLYN